MADQPPFIQSTSKQRALTRISSAKVLLIPFYYRP